jgi:hypothetical protein
MASALRKNNPETAARDLCGFINGQRHYAGRARRK